MKSRYTGKRRSPQVESCGGFSLLEVIFAIVILAVGILSLAGLFAASAGAVRYAQEDHIAKQKAREAIEGVYSSRNDTSITFDQIQNISNGGIFKDGFQTMYLPGPNGIVGTGRTPPSWTGSFCQARTAFLTPPTMWWCRWSTIPGRY